MQTSRHREHPDPRSFAARKGHLPQLSISDDNHHVTEAIGYMYGDEDSPSSPQSPARFSTLNDRSLDGELDGSNFRHAQLRKSAADYRHTNGDRLSPIVDKPTISIVDQRNGWDGRNGESSESSVRGRDRSPSETAHAHFPLNDIDYESSPAAVAQELSNLQALRRMSMDVAAAGDPDLPQLSAAGMPSAPSAAASEDDSARLFWVPARLHPELAPKEFKSFLESKAEQIKRRSGELSAFNSPIASRSSSLSSDDGGGGLQRKKSMLSRQINSSIGYQDGADILEQKRSRDQQGQPVDPNLEELESLVSSGASSPRPSLDSKIDADTGDVILPSIPGSSLKRSTRTKYQRPASRKGPSERGTYAERAKRRAEAGGSVSASPAVASVPLSFDTPLGGRSSIDAPGSSSGTRDPTSSEITKPAMNFSRPGTSSPSYMSDASRGSFESSTAKAEDAGTPSGQTTTQEAPRVQPAIAGIPSPDKPIPQIVESPPPEDHPVRTSSMVPPPSTIYNVKPDPPKQAETSPQKDPRSKPAASQRPGMPSKASSTLLSNSRLAARGSAVPPQTPATQSLEQPSPLPGHENNTSNLSIIPTLTADKRPEQKKKEEKKSGWSWLLGKEESDKEKSKSKAAKNTQPHDSTRLDLLQTSIDGGPKGRESLVLDRDNLRLEEERKKESQRKSSGSEKKEKEGIFASIFGGKRSKAEKESQKRAHERLSPEPPHRELKPDIDYNWTRFSILEERAIYRMAHIKLANPRRALYSQVLLSNFMYSYLAKVQQMHPQMNLPTSAKQQRKQKEQQQLLQQQQQQPDEFTQYQRYQQQQAQLASASQDTSGQPPDSRSSLEGDSTMYNYNYSRGDSRPDSRGSKHAVHSSASGGSDYYSGNNGGGAGNMTSHYQQPQQHPSNHQRQQQSAGGYGYEDNDDDDMW